MDKKLSFASVIIFLSIFFGAQSIQAEVKTQKITSLEEPTWVFKTGMSRGKYHDRQDLGVVLDAGTTIKIRKSSTADGYKNLSFWLLGNNRNTEKSATITNDWQTIIIQYSGVPFINTPYGSKDAEIEYEIEGLSSKLPIYNKKSSQDSFFSEWDASNAAFGLVQGDKFQLLIPVSEKNTTKKLPDFASLNDYISYQDNIITYYDDVMGLSSSVGINKTPQNRFFLKGDGGTPSGVGAYYGNNYTANGKVTVANMWMKKWSHATLHELGHAYQPSYNNKGMYTGEISNNLLVTLFIYEHKGKIEGDRSSWLYNYGKKESVEASLYELLINQNQGYANLDHRRRLILLTDLTQSVGKENWMKLNIFYREAMNNGNTTIANMSLPDLFTLFYSGQTQKDYSPVFGKWGLSLTSTRQPTINRGNDYPAVTSLVDVVPKDRLNEVVTVLSPSLFVDSQFSLVTNQDLATLALPGGALTVHLKIDEFEQLKGKTVKLKNGQQIVREVIIDSPDLVISNLKNGIYTMSFPETEKRYTISNYYGYVRDKQNETTVIFTELAGSQIFDETIFLKGLSYTLATVKTDFQHQKVIVDVILNKPHSYFAGKTYASIEVVDENGEQIYEKIMEGTDVTKEKLELPLKEGYQIKIYHAETSNRLTATTDSLIDKSSKTNVLVVNNGHLVNQKGMPATAVAVDKIIAAVDNLKKDPAISVIKESPEKNQIVVAILFLPEAERDTLLEKYQDFLNLKPGTITVQYLDEQGTVLSAPDIQVGRFGESRQFLAKEFFGYELKGIVNSIDLMYSLKPLSYSFVYKKEEGTKNKLVLKDVGLLLGDRWEPEMHIDELVRDNKAYSFTDAVQSGVLTYAPHDLDTSKIGMYDVTYSYGGLTSTAKVTVKESLTSIVVKDSTLTVGDSWTAEDNFISATDKSGNIIIFNTSMVSDMVDTTKAGIYQIRYVNDGVTKTITVTVVEKLSPKKPTTPKNPNFLSPVGADKAQDNIANHPKSLPKAGEATSQFGMLSGLILILIVNLFVLRVKNIN